MTSIPEYALDIARRALANMTARQREYRIVQAQRRFERATKEYMAARLSAYALYKVGCDMRAADKV